MTKSHIVAICLAVLSICLVTGEAAEGRSTNYTIDRQVLSGSRAPAIAGSINPNPLLGQTAISPSISTTYRLGTGYWSEQPAATASHWMYLPLIFKAPTYIPPDLVVDSLNASGGGVAVVIRNSGPTPVVDAFWVDVYFNPSQMPTVNKPWDSIASHGVVWGVTSPIPAGGSLTLTNDISDLYYFPVYSSTPPLPVGADVYVLVDSINYRTTYGAVQESDESNNLHGPVTSTAVTGQVASSAGQGPSPSTEGLPARWGIRSSD
jgi:hypothetical protein